MSDIHMKSLGVIILAAGVGKRMKSNLLKVLHPICGRPMLSYIIDTAVGLSPEKIVIVSSPKMEEEILRFAQNDRWGRNDKEFKSSKVQWNKIEFVIQDPPRGTGDAVMCAESIFSDFDGPILVLCGDVPLLKSDTLNNLIKFHNTNKGAATVLTTIVPDPASYGRVVKSKIKNQKSKVKKIVEATDASESIKRIDEINTGIYIFDKSLLFDTLHKIKPSNVQGEYYLTDTIEILCNEDKEVYGFLTNDWQEVIGINTRKTLADVESMLQAQIIEHHQLNGVAIKNHTTIDFGVKIGSDTIIHSGAFLLGNTQVGENCEIGANTAVEDSIISSGTIIGANSDIRNAKL
ncbi:MAG: NTP transferase domain-containing protein [Candidatus Stahlbacteria bacterium]|nr:NTP transferase domain-containing protein [Candidatus Stahlbacteria bacterium]